MTTRRSAADEMAYWVMKVRCRVEPPEWISTEYGWNMSSHKIELERFRERHPNSTIGQAHDNAHMAFIAVPRNRRLELVETAQLYRGDCVDYLTKEALRELRNSLKEGSVDVTEDSIRVAWREIFCEEIMGR